MNPSDPRPSDAELDQLLASRLKRTSPEFEQRWRELRGELAGSPAPRAAGWRWLLWPGLAAAGAAAVAVALVLFRPHPAPEIPALAAYEELLALDSALTVAEPLLEPENREALLHLPANSPSRLP